MSLTVGFSGFGILGYFGLLGFGILGFGALGYFWLLGFGTLDYFGICGIVWRFLGQHFEVIILSIF